MFRGTPKWFFYNGKPYQNGWFGGKTHHFRGCIKLPWSENNHIFATFAVPASWCPLRPRQAGGLCMIFLLQACETKQPKTSSNCSHCQSKRLERKILDLFCVVFLEANGIIMHPGRDKRQAQLLCIRLLTSSTSAMMVSWTYMVFWSIYKMNKQHIKLHNRKQLDTLGKFSVDPKTAQQFQRRHLPCPWRFYLTYSYQAKD